MSSIEGEEGLGTRLTADYGSKSCVTAKAASPKPQFSLVYCLVGQACTNDNYFNKGVWFWIPHRICCKSKQ